MNNKSKAHENIPAPKTPKSLEPIPEDKERSDQDAAFLETFYARKEKRPKLPKMVPHETDENTINLECQFDNELEMAHLSTAFGSVGSEFMQGLINQLTNVDKNQINFMLSSIAGIGAQDAVEAMLATQMVSVHMATMRQARLLANSMVVDQIAQHEKSLNRLARTFAAQTEALKKYRSKGEQKMTVEHVHVNEGGQAIIGEVHHNGGDQVKKGDQGYDKKSNSLAPVTPMPSQDAAENVVPMSGNAQR